MSQDEEDRANAKELESRASEGSKYFTIPKE